MKQFFYILVISLAAIALIFFSYTKFLLLVSEEKSEPFNIVFDESLTHSNLYAPKNLKIKAKGKDSVEVSWDLDDKQLQVNSGVPWEFAVLSGFRIYRDGYWYKDVSKDIKKFVDDKLYPNETYSYSISALTFDFKIEGQKNAKTEAETPESSLKEVNFPVSDIKSYLSEGDSVTEAKNIAEGLSWVGIVAGYLKQNGHDVEVSHMAVAGSTAGSVDDRIGREVESINPDMVTIAVGVNDIVGASRDIGNISMSDFRDHLRSIIAKTKSGRDRNVALLNIFYITCCSEKRVAWDKVVRDVANEYGVLYIDVSTPIIQNGGKELLAGDLHPNAAGHKVIAGAVIEKLDQMLK